MLIHKNNSDHKGNSYGSHENYLMDRRTSFKQIVEHLMPFFVSRQVYSGAGKVGSENRAHRCDYQLSQRADFFETEVALDTMVKRPIINTRDEPHADREKYRRLHVIVGDANMSEYTIWLRQGTTALVLSMIEDGAIEPRPLAARPGAGDQGGLSRSEPAADRRAPERQAAHRGPAPGASTWSSRSATRPSRRSSPGTGEVAQGVGDRRSTPSSATRSSSSDRIDWVTKKVMIERFMERKGVDWESAQVQMMDLQYHDIRPEKGLYHLLERQGQVRRVVTDGEIMRAITEPPEDTRAYFRGHCLKRYGDQVFGVNWDSISFGIGDEPIKRVLMAEPLKGSKAHVAELLRAFEGRGGARQKPARLRPGGRTCPSHSRSRSPAAARAASRDAGEGAKKLAKKGEALKEEMDSLMDEIDEVLEENAEEFVKNYVQRGGQ